LGFAGCTSGGSESREWLRREQARRSVSQTNGDFPWYSTKM
jgi:hypothetical protein